MKSVLCTGGAGFIGRHLSRRLVSEGWRVTVLDDFSTGSPYGLDHEVEPVRGDVSKPFLALGTFDLVYHLAALSRIGLCGSDPNRARDVNFCGTLNAVHLAKKSGCKIVFTSTSAAAEPDLSVYARTKSCAEKLFPACGVPSCVLRPFNVYGPGEPESGPASTVVARFLKSRRDGSPLRIHGDGGQRRDFVDVRDAVDALVLAGTVDTDTRTYDLGTGTSFSVREVAEMVGGPVEFVPRPGGEQELTRADAARLVALGWKPRYNLPDWIESQVRK